MNPTGVAANASEPLGSRSTGGDDRPGGPSLALAVVHPELSERGTDLEMAIMSLRHRGFIR